MLSSVPDCSKNSGKYLSERSCSLRIRGILKGIERFDREINPQRLNRQPIKDVKCETMKYFTRISADYEENSLVQSSAAETLLELAQIDRSDVVLDLGCGPGHITARIRETAESRIFGFDASEGMIDKARAAYGNLDIDFRVMAAEELTQIGEYDLIFCNSAFQWFRRPDIVVRKCFNALRTHGRMVVQTPATSDYCPNFFQALQSVKKNRKTGDSFSSFENPWFFGETADDYTSLFSQTAFIIKSAAIETTESRHTPEEVFRIFKSGAAAGYLNREYYPSVWPEDYEDIFLDLMRESFQKQAVNGQIQLVFKRIFLHAEKPR